VRDLRVGFCTWQVCENSLVGDDVFAKIYGYDVQQVAAGVPIENLLSRIAPGDRERIAKEVHEAIISGNAYNTSFRVLSPQGVRHVTYFGRCLRDAEGLPSFFSGTISEHLPEENVSDSSSAELHCRAALGFARRQHNTMASHHLAKALTALGSTLPQ